jgi:hypothetical protein
MLLVNQQLNAVATGVGDRNVSQRDRKRGVHHLSGTHRWLSYGLVDRELSLELSNDLAVFILQDDAKVVGLCGLRGMQGEQ